MKIVCVHQSSELYGSDRSFLAAVEAMAKNHPESSEIEVVIPDHGPLVDLIAAAGGSVVYEPQGYLRRSLLRTPVAFVIGLLAAAGRLRRKFRNADLVYVNTLVCASALLACVFTARAARKVLHVREIPGPRELALFRVLIRLSGAEVVYNSIATMKALGLPGTVIYNGVPGPFEAAGEDLAAGELRLLMIGRINAWKGQKFLLEALSSSSRRIQLRIVGSAIDAQIHLVKELRELAKTMPETFQCDFFEFCEDPSEHYRWCNYVVVPSTSPEPFGRVAIEGLSYGKPVVAAGHGGLLEIISDEKDGFIFCPGDHGHLLKIITMLPDTRSSDYVELSKAAHQTFSSRFSSESYSRQIVSLLPHSAGGRG
ncbi:glycosyltransferase family 4 protein [Stenotrophomonas cyclobalanopsidis]|uniref:Glycosyltransferase family 4 protein n=1 Tax=Stenotrophomonas cyclobalanopsidis TaxID=2771362 RepID=A0ABQ6T1N7_9GAMM|nr:glycosyltransferase [Stenotrophomonas cyclobalanopsidis]KAA8999574.1 glycosyltransferase family 4 protein [Stenotrophomonas cyclobalanopsidis]